MSRFTADLTMTQMADQFGGFRLWKLHEPLSYEVGKRGAERLIVVPAGFVSDGPTIPRALWAIFPVWGSWGRAGILHDYLCARIAIGNPHREAKTRPRADLIFYQAMLALGVGFVPRHALCLGVRIGTLLGARPNSVDYNRDILAREPEV